jgi:hypothetical protein
VLLVVSLGRVSPIIIAGRGRGHMSDYEPDLKFDAEYLRTLEYLLDIRPSPRPVMKVGRRRSFSANVGIKHMRGVHKLLLAPTPQPPTQPKRPMKSPEAQHDLLEGSVRFTCPW